jgi:electron transfer flavoprotein alpha subunit
MSKVLAITETQGNGLKKAALEIVTEARKIADSNQGQVIALAIGANIKEAAAELGEYGADKVVIVDDASLENYQTELYKASVVQAAKEISPDVILFSATIAGKDLAPRVAAALDATLASDCTGLLIDNGKISVTRPLYAGKVIANVDLVGSPQIASLRPNVFDAIKSTEGAQAAVEDMPVPSVDVRVETIEVNKTGGDKLDVADADIIVTGGRGLRDADSFKLVEDLAQTLEGAVGATRAVVDSGWRTHDEQVGQTGKVVSPNLYFMCGASGSIQHWAGMSGSRCIVAINKDEAAPIMGRADYSIVGDVFEILPTLNEEIKKIRG